MTPTLLGDGDSPYTFDHAIYISYSFKTELRQVSYIFCSKKKLPNKNIETRSREFFRHQVHETEVGEIHSSHGQEGQLHIFHQASSSQPFRIGMVRFDFDGRKVENGVNSTGWEKPKKKKESRNV